MKYKIQAEVGGANACWSKVKGPLDGPVFLGYEEGYNCDIIAFPPTWVRNNVVLREPTTRVGSRIGVGCDTEIIDLHWEEYFPWDTDSRWRGYGISNGYILCGRIAPALSIPGRERVLIYNKSLFDIVDVKTAEVAKRGLRVAALGENQHGDAAPVEPGDEGYLVARMEMWGYVRKDVRFW